MHESIYSTHRWRSIRAQAIARDGSRCTVARLLGGRCSTNLPLHAHHIKPVSDGGAAFDLDNVGTTCARHHPIWEALRRRLVELREPERPRCPHVHRTREGREICERRLARARGVEELAA
jgi:5-methylcytosine-specific restriction endonuclease McrA